jgi:hypothetical protein
LLFDNQTQEQKNLNRTKVVREPRIDIPYFNNDGSTCLKLPNERVYQTEKVPLVFQCPGIEEKMFKNRNMMERNLKEA